MLMYGKGDILWREASFLDKISKFNEGRGSPEKYINWVLSLEKDLRVQGPNSFVLKKIAFDPL